MNIRKTLFIRGASTTNLALIIGAFSCGRNVAVGFHPTILWSPDPAMPVGAHSHRTVSTLHMARKVTTTVTSRLTMSTSSSRIHGKDSDDTIPIPGTLSRSQHILFDMPVSNNGARCRVILYKKNIPKEEVEIMPPSSLGGLKSPEYLKRSPLGLMPCLEIQKGGVPMSHISESDTISRYFLSEYADRSPSFLPNNPKSNLICRWHDLYLTPVQGSLYKASSRLPMGDYADRKRALEAFQKNLNIIEGWVPDVSEGIYLCGKEVSLADATLFPTTVFANYMLPKFGNNMKCDPLPAKISRWFHGLRTHDQDFSRIFDEIMDVLVNSWEEKNHRWDDIWLAGRRDTAPSTIFDEVISGDVPVTIVKEDEHILAFQYRNPSCPAHILVIPKCRNGLTNLRQATQEHTDILGRLLVAAGELANNSSLGFSDGARIVINEGKDGGQEVNHLHVHVLGGRKMKGELG